MTLAQEKKKAQKAVGKFNSLYPVGTKMILVDDWGNEHEIKTYAPANVVSCQACCWATSDTKHWGCYLLERFKPIKNA